ncbi:hypothetical protein [Bradyrhizobium brasilense]|uniref:hypothetical protein n=1 Tax=Bradyrhizobium brasilense TaxID=1419277 RepID=UPI0015A142B8|nr:hypothetical protein [Bradyrhizobium brasilense]
MVLLAAVSMVALLAPNGRASAQFVCADASSNTGGATATNSTDVACGPNAVANGAGILPGSASAFGNGAQATGMKSTAIGASSQATNASATAVGMSAVASGTAASAFGESARASGGGATAIGSVSNASGFESTAVGSGAQATGGSSVAVGNAAEAPGVASTAVGTGAKATDFWATALGNQARAASQAATALGNIAQASAIGSTAVGTGAQATGAAATALGNDAQATGAAAMALGTSARATNANDAALGAGSVTAGPNAGATALFGGTAVGQAKVSSGVVSVGASGVERQIQNVAAGVISATSTDAINGSQLNSVATGVNNLGNSVANTLGGATTFNPATGQISGFSALVNGTTYNNVTSALNAIETQIANLNTGSTAVQYSSAATPATPNANQKTATQDATMVGAVAASAVALHNVAAGSLSTNSADAVNGSQLFTTNQNVATNTTSIATLQQNAIQWDSTANAFSATHGSAAPQKIANVAAGTLSATSTDAVNGSQLNTTNQNLTNLTNSIVNGTIGLVQQTGGSNAPITVGAQTGGRSVNVAGTSGNRVVTGVAAGAINSTSTDAVNGSQLFASANSVANALGGGAVVNGDGSVSGPSYTVQGTTYHNVADALTAAGSQSANAVQYDTVNGKRQNAITLQGGSAGPVAIHNVASGTAPTDAANMQQLNSGLVSMSASDRAYTDAQVAGARQLARAAGATASAMAGLHRVDLNPRQGAISGAIGGFDGTVAVAAAVDYRFTRALQVNAGVSYAPDINKVGWTAGASYIFN